MSNYKFTADGKKVAVIGALNAKETIVQEIFVADGTEFPAGEHFVVKTLLDAPAETYLAKQNRKEEETKEKLKRELAKIRAEISGFRIACAAAASKIKWTSGITDQEVSRVFDHVRSAITGEYTHVVFSTHSGLEIKEWDAELFSKTEGYGEGKRFDGIRLVSMYGVWNGRLELDWRVHSYSDGSGYGSSHFTPFKSLQDAIDFCEKTINAKEHITYHDVKFCLEYGIAVDEVKNAARVERMKEDLKKEIARRKEALLGLEEKLLSVE